MSLDRLEAWKLGKSVAVRIYRLSRQKPLKYHPKLADQVQRAAVSVPANIAEVRARHAPAIREGTADRVRLSPGVAYHFEIACDVPAVPRDDATAKLAGDIRLLIAMIVGLLKRYGAEPPS